MINPPRDESLLSFPAISTIDACAVWNILCSRTLTSAAKCRHRHFILTDYVRYECLIKPRKKPTDIDIELQAKLESELATNLHFSSHSLKVEDLRDVVSNVGVVRRFHRGELAALALARKLNHCFVTDDYAARSVAENSLGTFKVRTTPHLVGWLVYERQLTDGDIPRIIADNKAFRNSKGHLGDFIQACYEHAMMLRLRNMENTAA
jgi:predicted nucleic acid-binding protein